MAIKPVIEMNKVSKIYGGKTENQVFALNDVSFTMQEGEFIGIMGASGSGKTTLLNVVSTLDHPTEGTVAIAGTDITRMKARELSDFRAQRLGFIFQEFNLLDNLTVYENVALPLSLQDLPVHQIMDRVGKVLEQLGIAELADKYPATISGGQRQRTAAARAIVHEPALLLGDEPTGSLDTKNAVGLLEQMKRLNEQQQISILMVTHDAFSASYCSRILFIQDGRLVQELYRLGSREAFYKQILNVLGDYGAAAAEAAAKELSAVEDRG
ncbi:ABC transporter ATP-binding protein [Paenibacillus radicis (ex Gao et al. 2016)]|uniref:ABC transporter ATP-binding protein n=1 Tax=Paenibacillus radicis (ex Gao et al. 2016) TaxID=1737354 RepID=A0A917H1C4_9BACL|nr:ABC transporter ATP-binding protein [Paenibacillus radicis (ex Gao et al. 2016)]GGG64394.1 ABC transporter ATP-binding protein [Paenibacillus radicis (ex Gao et al. 2016)]